MQPEDTVIEDWVPPVGLPEIPAGCTVALDLETHDPGLKGRGPGWAFDNGYPVGVALAWGIDDILGYGYWPLRHISGNWNGDVGKFMRWLRHTLRRGDLEWAFANASYDLGWLNIQPEGRIHDVQVSAPLLNEHRYSYGLDALAKEALGQGKDESLLKDWAKRIDVKYGEIKSMMALLPSFVVGPYAEQDALATWKLNKLYLPQIASQNLGQVYKLEMDIVPMLMDMRRTGVRVNVPAAEELREIVLVEEREAARALRHLTGLSISAWDIELQMRALRAEGVTSFPKTAKKKVDGLTAPYLEKLASKKNKAGEIATQILGLRRKNRQRVTFVERLVLDHHHNGRIHAQFNALKSDDGGTVSGRFSSQDPNLQQLPARDEEAATRIRSLFLPEHGEQIASVDYASQEPRLAIHWAVKGGSKAAARMAQEFHENPRLDLHQKVADLMGVPRKQSKILNLAQMYGQGGGSLCLSLGLPASPDSFVNEQGVEIEYLAPGREGRALLEEYNRIVPFMKATAKGTERKAREDGYTTTLFGRRCRVFTYPNGGDDARKMFNRRIQGSAADMIKKAMLLAWEAGMKLRMTVHDENVFSVSGEKEARQCAEIMNSAVDLVVPVVCDLAIGDNWGTMREVAT